MSLLTMPRRKFEFRENKAKLIIFKFCKSLLIHSFEKQKNLNRLYRKWYFLCFPIALHFHFIVNCLCVMLVQSSLKIELMMGCFTWRTHFLFHLLLKVWFKSGIYLGGVNGCKLLTLWWKHHCFGYSNRSKYCLHYFVTVFSRTCRVRRILSFISLVHKRCVTVWNAFCLALDIAFSS